MDYQRQLWMASLTIERTRQSLSRRATCMSSPSEEKTDAQVHCRMAITCKMERSIGILDPPEGSEEIESSRGYRVCWGLWHSDEPDFVWWVPYTMRKRDVILAAIKSCIYKTTHKYGIEIPRSITYANEIDRAQGNIFWRNTLAKKYWTLELLLKYCQTVRGLQLAGTRWPAI